MNGTRRGTNAFAIGGMLAVLVIARGLDALRLYFGRPSAPTFNPYAMIWSQSLGPLLLAALLLWLFWFVVNRVRPSAWVAAVYLLVGLPLAFALVLYFPPFGIAWPYFLTAVLSTSSYTTLAGSFIAITGLFMLILPRR